MDESVWLEQVDTGLRDFIRKHVKLLNGEGERQSVPVVYRKPDEDFKIETYPSMSFFLVQSAADVIRYDTDKIVVSKDIEAGTAQVEDSALPYTLFYQIDFWSKLRSEMNEMVRLWQLSHWRDFELPVLDMSGKERTCYCYSRHNLRESNLLVGKERIFHTIDTLRIWVELDPRIQETVPIIKNVIVDRR